MSVVLGTANKPTKEQEQLATFLAHGMSGVDIAATLGLSEGRISQLKDDPVVQEVLAAKLTQLAREQQELNEGWDAVEKRGIQIVQEHMRINKEPNFALRAATLANRAVRRGVSNANTIPATSGQRVTISLNVNFTKQLQAGRAETARVINGGNLPKMVDVALPAQVETMFAVSEDDTDPLSGDIAFGT